MQSNKYHVFYLSFLTWPRNPLLTLCSSILFFLFCIRELVELNLNQPSMAECCEVFMYGGAYVDLVIYLSVLRLFHNIKSGYGWRVFIAETMYNLWNTKPLLLVLSWCFNTWLECQNTHTVLCKVLNVHLWQVSLAGVSRSLIGHLSVTFGGTPNFDVADSLDGAYLGLFRLSKVFLCLPLTVGSLVQWLWWLTDNQ